MGALVAFGLTFWAALMSVTPASLATCALNCEKQRTSHIESNILDKTDIYIYQFHHPSLAWRIGTELFYVDFYRLDWPFLFDFYSKSKRILWAFAEHLGKSIYRYLYHSFKMDAPIHKIHYSSRRCALWLANIPFRGEASERIVEIDIKMNEWMLPPKLAQPLLPHLISMVRMECVLRCDISIWTLNNSTIQR